MVRVRATGKVQTPSVHQVPKAIVDAGLPKGEKDSEQTASSTVDGAAT